MKKFKLAAGIALLSVFAAGIQAQENSKENKSESVTEELSEMAARSAERTPPEIKAAAEKANEEIKATGILERAVNVGDTMPSFELADAYGKRVSSSNLLKKGPIVLVFYRGAWCPYCNLYLRGLQRRIPEFGERGAELVAISVEPPDRSLKVVENDKLNYTVLSDPGLETASRFRIVYELPEVLDGAMKGRGFDIGKYNGMKKSELPLSATYVVDTDGKIAYAFLEIDYKKRADPNDILKVLDTLRSGTEDH